MLVNKYNMLKVIGSLIMIASFLLGKLSADTPTEREITEVLEYFQSAYTARDTNRVDEFMERLFTKNDYCNVIGTSINEWCLGYQEVSELFKGDWEYWGDVKLKIEEAVINQSGNICCVYVPSTVKYTFDHKPETDERYLGYMISDLRDEDIENDSKLRKIRLQEVNFVLNHYLHQRDKDVRDYYWDLGISFIMEKVKKEWKIRQMHYSMPVDSAYPDCRISKYSYYQKLMDTETASLREAAKGCDHLPEIINKIAEFSNGMFDIDICSEEIFENYFSDQVLLVDTDMNCYLERKAQKEIIDHYRSLYDRLSLNVDAMIMDQRNEIAWFALNGIIHKTQSEDEAIELAYKDIDQIIESDDTPRTKLFKMRRVISTVTLQTAIGEEYNLPIRLEGMLTKSNGKWKFNYLNLSFPFDTILEEKNDLSSRG